MARKILIIDDETELRKMLKARLEANGYTVLVAGDGEAGLQQWKTGQPDLIILDIMMPKMDGYTFVREAQTREDLPQVPIVVLTAKDSMKDLFDLERVDDYIVKPFDPEELLGKIKRYFE